MQYRTKSVSFGKLQPKQRLWIVEVAQSQILKHSDMLLLAAAQNLTTNIIRCRSRLDGGRYREDQH